MRTDANLALLAGPALEEASDAGDFLAAADFLFNGLGVPVGQDLLRLRRGATETDLPRGPSLDMNEH